MVFDEKAFNELLKTRLRLGNRVYLESAARWGYSQAEKDNAGKVVHLHRNTTELELLCREEYYAARDAKIREKLQRALDELPLTVLDLDSAKLLREALLLLEGGE